MRALALLIALVAGAGPQINPLLRSAPGPRYLTFTTSAKPSAVKPGEKVSLFVDVTPNPGIHVYAPGAQGYLSIGLVVAASESAVPLGQVSFPKSEIYVFPALNERVPVYQKPFRLTQEVTISPSVKSVTPLTVTGLLRYQACDDKVCFAPDTVPVDWLLQVAEPDQKKRPTKG